MGLSSQFQDLMKGAADFRQEIFGVNQAGEEQKAIMENADPDATFTCYYSPANETELLSPFGIKNDFDLILRVRKTETNFVPEIGRNVKLLAVGPDNSDLVVRLVKPRVHPVGVEHVFECKSL